MTQGAIRAAGDSAFVIELEPRIDPEVNARATGIAAAIRRDGLAGVRDVVSTYRSVAIYVDPLVADTPSILEAAERALAAPAADERGAVVEVPVSYGGEDGPDLEEVAQWAGLSSSAVIERHAAREYRVFMLGFLPGFAYMGVVDPAIAAPRRVTPRLKVPAGSIGIAASQTGVYPCESPGGWRIIGRTPLDVFDLRREQPALLAPGDRVRFVPSTSLRPGPSTPDGDWPSTSFRPGKPNTTHTSGVTVVQPGLFTTIQDEGRWGHQAMGVSVSGAMDSACHRVANVLAGNPREAATLEITLAGPELRIEQETTVAIAGADLGATLDGAAMPTGSARRCWEGSVLRFGARRAGGRAYVAFAGGIDVPLVLGSRSTHVRSRIGGFDGRALRAGDRLPLGAARAGPAASRDDSSLVRGGARLRVLPGPQEGSFPPHALELLQSIRFTVAPQSDRMGYRLAGASALPSPAGEMISDAAFLGAVQVPPSGQPILLMADRQTTGGYPQIAIVIAADLPQAGQLVPGDWVEFSVCSRGEALAALAASEERLRTLG